MARTAKDKEAEKQQRARLAYNARIDLLRFMAFTGIEDYFSMTEFSAQSGYRKMDATECTTYYIEKGWMTGEPLRNSGSYYYSAHLSDFKCCAVIAHTSLDDVERIFKVAVESTKPKWSYDKSKLKDSYCLLTKALNAYCRAFPDRLAVFQDMDDFPVVPPDADEQRIALERWEMMKQKMGRQILEVIPLNFLSPLIKNRLFKDFFDALNITITGELIWAEVKKAENFRFLQQEDYEHLLALSDRKVSEKEQLYLDSIRDALILYHHFLLNGDIAAHKAMMSPTSHPHLLLTACEALQNGRANEAYKMMYASLRNNGSPAFNYDLSNFLYGVSILLSDLPAASKKAETLLKKKNLKENAMFSCLRVLLQKKAHPETDFNVWTKYNLKLSEATPLGKALLALVCKHYGLTDAYSIYLENYTRTILDNSVKALAVDFLRHDKQHAAEWQKIMEETKLKPVLPEFKILEPWEIILNTLLDKYDKPEKSATATKRTKAPKLEVGRVIYHLNTNSFYAQPRLQKSKDGGMTWSGGRNIALKSFMAGIPEMTEQDRKVARLVQVWDYGWYGGSGSSLDGEDVVEALAGHPFVFDEHNTDLKIDIVKENLQIEVQKVSDGYKVVSNATKRGSDFRSPSITIESPQLIKVISISKEEKEILTLLDKIGTFPKESKEQLTKLLTALGKQLTVMSPLLKNAENVKQEKGDSHIVVQLVPNKEEFSVRCYVKPLVDCPPYCTPGTGMEMISASVKGKPVHVSRNLSLERKNLKALEEWMMPFADYETDNGWLMPMVSCLEVLDLLRQHTEQCVIEWPEGVRFSVSRPMLDSDRLKLSVKGIGQWFEIDGDVEIDDKQRMKVSELLQRVRQSKGRFIQVGDEEYIALSNQLHKQLAALARIAQPDKKTLKVATYNSSFLKELSDGGATLKADKTYKQMLKRMDEADTMTFPVPKNLQADLRSYQEEGFRWLSRLAHWGAGACLADDMGLGKTIQTIALLLSHAKEGASLVVMPTSVLLNWKQELQRFAPSLNPVILREAADRKEAIDNAGAQDVVLVTYGLLPSEEETLQSKQWNIIVLDEAHTIKNKETKTSKVAMTLDAHFRLLLTGTPLQNHLSEIWNLFQFATPGLLTGYTQFTQEFINPIERDQNKEAQRMLKRMLQPFILRRTKNEVLEELPEKTEITLKVELNDAERALYDRFREEALLNLEEGSATAIKALAELTRLRQTACNAALVLPEKEASAIPSSKMEAFLKLVEELQSNHHRALVFSQFTSHLALVQKQLERMGIDYQYLDGSISASERIKRVAEFQKGDMPLFLISLKAGGTGLNLTAADYVIHLDPWWNPSIEDQASDRAYRIGQDKPVTVYRIIAENTIEEKILALHKTKKSLADALLEGSNMSHALGKDEILNLIRGAE